MTRQHLSIQGVAETPDVTLPTSRHAPGQELGVLAILRALAPRRPLTPGEARLVAERQADRLLHLARLSGPPTPSALITELPRVTVRLDPDLPVSGGTHWVTGRWFIAINSSEPHERQRYSLAHEYKHALDHRYRHLMYQANNELTAHDQAELAADEFAAALLMPKRWVRQAWRQGYRNIEDLRQLFVVSPRAMAVRLHTMGLHSLAPSDPRYRKVAA